MSLSIIGIIGIFLGIFVINTTIISSQKLCACKDIKLSCLVKAFASLDNSTDFFYNGQCVTTCQSSFTISNSIKAVIDCCKTYDCIAYAQRLASSSCESFDYTNAKVKRSDTSVLRYRFPSVKRCFKCDFCKSESEGMEEICADNGENTEYSCFNQITYLNGRRLWKSGCKKTSLCINSSLSSKTEKTKKGCCNSDYCNTFSNAEKMLNSTLCETGFKMKYDNYN